MFPQKRRRWLVNFLKCDFLPASTSWKMSMELENHLFEKGKSCSKPSFSGSMLIFRGVVEEVYLRICPCGVAEK